MNDLYTNAKRMVSLFEQMRHARSSPAFALLKQLNLGPLGSGLQAAPLVTSTLLFHRAMVGHIGPRAGLEGWRS